MDFKDMAICDFALGIASDLPIAGGGCVSALAGAYGAALVAMVSQKTILNKKYSNLVDSFQQVKKESIFYCKDLLDAIQRDKSSFNIVKIALNMPKQTEEEITKRKLAMQEGLKFAAEAPLQVAETVVKLLPLCRETIERGNKNAASDALVGVLMLRSAILGSVYNVKINLQSIKDNEYCEKMRARANQLQKIVVEEEKKLLALMPELTEIA